MIKREPLDILFTRYIKLLCGGYCTRCKRYLGVKSQGLHCAHFKSRGLKKVRWDRDNATALCYGCHRYIDHPNNRLIKIEFFMNLLGTDRFNALEERAKQTHPKPDKESIKSDLKEKIKILEGK